MHSLRLVITLLLFLVSLLSFAQKNLAYEMMDEFEYTEAILYFSKVPDKEMDDEAITRLAYCYIQEHDYVNAEKIYEKVVKIPYANPVNFKYYGIALKNNGKYKEAKNYLTAYSKIDSTDFYDKLVLQSLDKLPSLKAKAVKNVKAVNIAEVNNGMAQFAPKFYKGGVVFVSEANDDNNKKRPHIKIGSGFKDFKELHYGLIERPLAELFFADLTNEEVNNLYVMAKDSTFHIGAFDLDRSTGEIYFTKADMVNKWDNKNKTHTHICKAKIDEKTHQLTNIELVVIEGFKDKYAAGHPAITNDGKFMIFSSNMPGGFGGADLYVCEKKGNQWSTPINLGTNVNTKGDEDFPVFYHDQTLYFASNGTIGFGGFDIFKANYSNKKLSGIEILPEPYNSSADDFGFEPFDENSNWGYFTSNRFGGKGDDDIYIIEDVVMEKFARGRVTNNDGSIATDAIVKLFDSKGKEIARTKTNEYGKFKFKLDDKKDYTVVASKPGFATKSEVSTNSGKNVNKEIDLKLEPSTTAQGIVKNQDGNPAKNVSIKVYDENGKLIQETTTDENGYYQLVLEKDKTYNIVAETDSMMGQVVIKTDDNYDTLSNSDIILKPKSEVFGKIKDESGNSVAGAIIKLYDENGNVLAVDTTDANGNYQFKLIKDKNYQIVAGKGDYEGDENIYTGSNWDPKKALDITLRPKGKPTVGIVKDREASKGIDGVKIVITDKSTNKKTILFTDKDGKFKTRLRPKSGYIIVLSKEGYFPKTIEIPANKELPDNIDLNLMYDLALDKSGYLVKAIYFEFGKATITSDSKEQLDKLAQVMLSSANSTLEVKAYADCRGSEQTNLKLSIARAKSVKDYIIAKGIVAKRITTQSMGATNFVNNCYKPEMCSEEEHGLNRRAEFNINFESSTLK